MIRKIVSLLYLFISSIFFSIILVLNLSTFIHRLFVKFTNLNLKIELSTNNITSDYKCIIDYLRFPWINDLKLRYFSISDTAYFHFQEVKNIFSIIFIMYSLTVLIGVLFYHFYDRLFFIYLYKIFNFYFYFIISFVLLLSIFIFLNFSSSFALFHNILFNNNYWLFNPVKDSVILILPESFFMVCTLFIIGSILLISFICKLYYDKIKNYI